MGANSALEERCDQAARWYYKKQTPYCEALGKSSTTCWGTLEWAHIVSRRNMRLRYEPYNKLVLCHGHHAWWTEHPYEWKRFVRNHFPDRWREVEEHKNEYQRVNAYYYLDWLERFKSKEPRGFIPAI